MLFCTDLPHLKVATRKSFLPRGPKNPAMNRLCILCNIDVDYFNEYLENKLLYHDNKYMYLYMDSIYKLKVGSKTFRGNLRKDITEIYDKIESNNNRMHYLKTFNAMKERNKYVSLLKHNEIFFNLAEKSSMQYIKKIEEYINLLNSNLNRDEYVNYGKVLMINIDEWLNIIHKKNSNKLSFNDPINILFFAMKRKFELFKSLGNINIFIFNNKSVLRINPSECNEKSLAIFKRELIKINRTYSFLENDDDVIDNIENREELISELKNKLSMTLNFTGKTSDTINKKISDKVEDVVISKGITNHTDVEEELNKDLELVKAVARDMAFAKVGKSSASSKRDEELREKQMDINIQGKTLRDILNEDVGEIKPIDVSDKTFTTNKNATKVKFSGFEKAYNSSLYKKDMLNSFKCLSNDKTIPVFIKDIKTEDTSDSLNLKETYTISLEDGNRVRHTVKFDMPILIEDKFMYLAGNKKLIDKQMYMKPVVKTSADTVQISTNYNKIFLTRFGTKISPRIEKFNKLISQGMQKSIKVSYGNNKASNGEFKSTIEYDVLSESYNTITVGTKVFMFNRIDVDSKLEKLNIKIKDNELCVGFDKNKIPIIMNLDTQLIGNKDIISILIDESDDKFRNEFNTITVGKKYAYTRAKVLGKSIPLIILLGYFEGLANVMKRSGINYRFSDTRIRIDDNTEGIIQFADGYLIYDKYPYENSLLMNALSEIPTKAFNFVDLNEKDAYADIFDMKFNQRNLGNDLITYYEFMIDSMTKEDLKHLGLPEDIVGLLLHGNKLLVDNSSTKEYKMDIYRIRSNEIINVFLYKAVAHAYSQYRKTANNKNPIKISIPQDVVLKEILTAQTIQDYSILNPIVELEKSRAVSPKGPSGLNVSRAYTQEKRSYDKSMLGIISMSTSPDGNCGVVRQLTMEPSIKNARGYMDINDDVDKLKDTNLFSPAELLSPLGASRDDTVRTAMATKQSKHIVPVNKATPVLISNGSEQVVQYHLSSDFTIVAKDDGKVIEMDDDTALMILEYKNGEKQAVDLSPKIVKNGAGGFYLSNQLATKYKLNQKFSKNDIIASDSNFFTDNDFYGNRMSIGSFQKTMCMGHYSTFEDSTFITKKLSEDMMTKIIMPKKVSLGKNANVDYIVKVGQEVNVGDELLRFELSFQEDSMNSLLASIGDDLKEEIKSLGKTHIKSKYSGIVKDIKISSTVELDELSPSLRRLVSAYYKEKNKKIKLLNKHDDGKSVYKMGLIMDEPTGKITTKDGKVKGEIVGEGVLIEIYIEFEDTVGVGDKIVNFTALKSIVGMVIPDGLEPYSEHRPDEIISTTVAPGSVLARMTPSILTTMFGNKVLVELKRSLYEIYTGKKWECNEIIHKK